MHPVQQHQHGNLRFDHDNSEQHDLNNSQYIDHQQRHERQFQFNRRFSNSVAAQRDHGNGSEPVHAGQQHNSHRNGADQSATPERHG
jgi:hypothetical protein